jgi:hypothetical protein
MPVEVPKKKSSLLPVLTVLFLISYGLMTVLIVEQGATIQSQRNLIKILMRDSSELWAMKGKAITDKQMALDHNQSPSNQAKTPSQAPSTQAPATNDPASKNQSKHHLQSRAGKAAKPGFTLPPVPASDLLDQRRTLSTI